MTGGAGLQFWVELLRLSCMATSCITTSKVADKEHL